MTRGRLAVVLLLALALGAAALWGWKRLTALPDLTRYDAAIEAAAAESGVEANLLRALIATESGGDPDARSRAGARGLTQLMPATAREQAERMGIADWRDGRELEPALNVRLGAAYLARMLRRFGGQVPLALAAYNAGASRVDRWRAAQPGAAPEEVVRREGYDETRRHLERTLEFLAAYRALYGARGAPPPPPGGPTR